MLGACPVPCCGAQFDCFLPEATWHPRILLGGEPDEQPPPPAGGSAGMKKGTVRTAPHRSEAVATAGCVCGAVRLELDYPAFWAWHDHSEGSRRAQGCAYATYVGVWKSKLRVTKGADHIARFADKTRRTVRSFCKLCGTPLLYERGSSPKMVNVPRALFKGRTGR